MSAECHVLDQDFRRQLVARLEAARTGFGAYVSTAPPTTANYEVVLALMVRPASRTQPAIDLPFFSKVMLRTAALNLQKMGYRVAVDGIAIQPGLSGVQAPLGRKQRAQKRATPRPAATPIDVDAA